MEYEYHLVDEQGGRDQDQVSKRSIVKPQQYSAVPTLIAALFICIILVLLLGAKCIVLLYTETGGERSLYAGLARNIPIPWTVYGAFDNRSDPSASDIEWEKLSIDLGVIALPDTYVEKMDLHRAQRLPWDDKKGVYLINAYHNLHCLLKMRTVLMDYHLGRPTTVDFAHITHCLDAFRQDIMCDADDTPRWSGYGHRITGANQYRMCRDWNQLNDWAKQYPSCWRYTEYDNVEERFSFCPKDSPYAEKIVQRLGSKNHLGE